jgi:hypothetical protein
LHAQGAVGMARLALTTIDLMTGVAAVVGPGGAATIVQVVDIMKFVFDNQRWIEKILNVIQTALKVCSQLVQIAPTLYNKIVDAVLIQVIWPFLPEVVKRGAAVVGPAVPSAMTPESLARTTGKLVATLGLQSLLGRLSVLNAIFKILSTVAVEAIKTVPKAIGIKVGQYKDAARSIVQSLKTIGVAIRDDDAQLIVEEVSKNAPKIKGLLDDLNRVLQWEISD